jgi:hypothetical protein
VEYLIATSFEDRAAAQLLVLEQYTEAGLIDPDGDLSASDDWVIFVAKDQGKVVATVSLVPDSDGLPMESVFGQEVGARRKPGSVLAEVVRFVGHGTFRPLCGLMARTAKELGVTELVAAVHPCSLMFYVKACGFEPIGPVIPYPVVNESLAVPICLSLEAAAKHPNFKQFFPED